MADGAEGLVSAVAAAVEEAGPVLFGRAEQIDLALGDREPTPANMRAAALEARRSGPGRRKGSRNKRTEELRTYLLSQYRHPVETLMAIQATDPDILAAELGITEAEATGLIIKAAAEAAPYVAGKMPVEIELAGKGHMTLYLGGAAVPGAGADPQRAAPGGISFGPPPQDAEFVEVSEGDGELSE